MEVASETVWSFLFLKVLNQKFKLFSRYLGHLFQLILFFFFFFSFQFRSFLLPHLFLFACFGLILLFFFFWRWKLRWFFFNLPFVMKTFNALHFLLNTTLAASSKFSACFLNPISDSFDLLLAFSFCLAGLFFVLKPRAELFTYLS